MTRLDVTIASRYLRSRRSSRLVSLITLIATGGVTVGVMALIVVMGAMTGFQNELQDKILVASPHLRVLTYGQGLRLDDWEAIRERTLEHPEVRAVAPFVLSQGLISAGHDYTEGAYVIGIEPDTGTMSVTALPRHFLSGDLTFATEREDVDGGIVLGRRLAERLSVFPGDVVTVISPAGSKFNPALGSFVPRYWRFEVTGHFETGMYEYDNGYAVLARAVAQQFAGLDEAVTGLEARLTDPWVAQRVGRELEESLESPYRLLDWQSQQQSLFSALQLEKLGWFIAVVLIIIVAAFNIVSTLTMLVADKTREIGILRAMGLPVRVVRRVFVLQGVVIGVVGTVLGTGLGLLAAYLLDHELPDAVSQALGRLYIIELDPSVYFIDHLPVLVNPLDLVVIAVASVTVATLATIYPAWQAATLNPVDAIRYE